MNTAESRCPCAESLDESDGPLRGQLGRGCQARCHLGMAGNTPLVAGRAAASARGGVLAPVTWDTRRTRGEP